MIETVWYVIDPAALLMTTAMSQSTSTALQACAYECLCISWRDEREHRETEAVINYL